MKEILPIAMPGTHQKFLKYFKQQSPKAEAKILDIGAGHGAFSQKLYHMGYKVSACDLFPEIFEFEEIECKKVDVTEPFPYPDNSFDYVVGIEVLEHVNDHENFFKEALRVLKPGGHFYASTPNILSFKSRIRFLFSGFYYSFNPLEMNNHDGLQHIASLTVDQYEYLAKKCGFGSMEYAIDRKQSTAKWLMFLYPFAKFYAWRKGIKQIHNNKMLLLGRLLFLSFKKF